MTVDVAIATSNDRAYGLDRLLKSVHAERCLVIHQFYNGGGEEFEKWSVARLTALYPKPRPCQAIEYLKMRGKGLARSRNTAAEWSRHDLFVPTDDDVVFLNDAFEIISGAFERQPDADILTFRALTPEGNDYKKYPASAFRHTRFTIASVSSVEIVIRGAALRKLRLRWDERFGLGAEYSGGVELVFLSDALRRGAVARYVPEPIVVHPARSSGRIFDRDKAFIRGAIYGRMFGLMGLAVCLYHGIKHRRDYCAHGVGGASTAAWLFKGWRDYYGGRNAALAPAVLGTRPPQK